MLVSWADRPGRRVEAVVQDVVAVLAARPGLEVRRGVTIGHPEVVKVGDEAVPLTVRELAAVRRCVTNGRPYGSASWVEAMAADLALRLSQRPRGRPRKTPAKMN